ncbi:MAG: hypothetical protein OEV76_04545, partial [Anaerolineae bacterium]|nr:hypothetical protein [Anaerolineae bacterium]
MTRLAVALVTVALLVVGGTGLAAFAARDALPQDAFNGLKDGVQEVLGEGLSVLEAGSGEKLGGDDAYLAGKGEADELDDDDLGKLDDDGGDMDEPDDDDDDGDDDVDEPDDD